MSAEHPDHPHHSPGCSPTPAEANGVGDIDRVAVLGLGEAGRRYAAGLTAAGRRVSGYDPAPDVADVPGVRRAGSAADAVAGAGLVLCLTGAAHSVRAAEAVASALEPRACFADFNSSAPSAKRAVERALGRGGDSGAETDVADVAVLAPVPRAGARTPLLVSGAGAATVAAVLRPLGADVDVLDGEPVGAAAARKLLRSVFMKGLAAAVLETVTAGSAAGCEDWVRRQIADELGPCGAELVQRLVDGSRTHAARRIHEVRASRDYLTELGTPTAVCEASLRWLERLDATRSPGPDEGTGSHP